MQIDGSTARFVVGFIRTNTYIFPCKCAHSPCNPQSVGDIHDPKYDKYVFSATFGEAMDAQSAGRESHYTGLPLDDDYCTRYLSIYPSQEMENGFRSDDPFLFAMVAAGIFLFTSLVFIVYDMTVARRQRIVMNRAMASGAIVNSLFPAAVRDQMYEEKGLEQERETAVKNFRSDAGGLDERKSMAQLYPETTIFFADLAGFTKWSSKRTPIEVFHLLETL